MFSFKKNKKRIKRIHAIKPHDLKYLNEGSCSQCNKRVNIESLFTNSLIPMKGSLVVKCLACRSDGKLDLDTAKKSEQLNKEFMIFFNNDNSEKIEQMLSYIDNVYPSWIDLLYALRLGVIHNGYTTNFFYQKGYTQSERELSSSEYYNFLHSFLESEKRENKGFYGNLFSVKNCGECGYNWYPHDKSEKEKIHRNIIDEKKCPNCSVPNDMQWHMRTEFEKELIELHSDLFLNY